MVDTNTLQQFEDALMAYQENQETLNPVVVLAEQLCGASWVNDLSAMLQEAWANNPKRDTLMAKAEHAMNYYGALAAWNETSAYLSGETECTAELLQERMPVLEYWLNLFGEEGTQLLAQLKDLMAQKEQNVSVDQIDAAQPIVSPEQTETAQTDTSQVIEVVRPATITENVEETEVAMPVPVASDSMIPEESILDQAAEKIRTQSMPKEDDVQSEQEDISPVPVDDNISVEPADVVNEPVKVVEPEPMVQVEEKEEVIKNKTSEPEPDLAPVNEVKTETISEEKKPDVASVEVVDETPKKEPETIQSEVTQIPAKEPEQVPPDATQVTPDSATEIQIETFEEKSEPIKKQTVVEETTPMLQSEEEQTDKAIQELEQLHALYEDNNAEKEKTPNTERITTQQMPEITEAVSVQTKQKVVDTNEPGESRNWDIATFLRLNKLYNDVSSWLSAWCIRMDNADKITYPHYGFIVDLMYDLKDKATDLLDNQLLDEIIEHDVAGGRETVKKIKSALEDEIAGLPDDLKLSTPEKVKLSAQEILGKLDTSSEDEDIGAPPDGFELMDDPYAVSTEQIISDFEKTEQEAQNQIDKLDIVDKNVEKKGTKK